MVNPIKWFGDSRTTVEKFSRLGRRLAAGELFRVQAGAEPLDWKPLRTIGAGAREIRVHAEHDYRIIYVAQSSKAVYVLHALEAKAGDALKARAPELTALSENGADDEDDSKHKIKMERGCGNVFGDVGFAPAEAHNMLLRAELALRAERFIKDKKLTQAAAAKALGLAQPRLNQLLRGKFEVFSIDALVKMLIKAGLRVELRVKNTA
ncbi:MAG: XRE family transcriptional regulator [Pseudomonadota bacterium]